MHCVSLVHSLQSIGVEALTQSVCDLALGFGEGKKDGEKKKKMSRPFGVALLLAGFDRREGAQLFFSDPSGTLPLPSFFSEAQPFPFNVLPIQCPCPCRCPCSVPLCCAILAGTYFQYKAKAIGAGSEGAQATLQDKYRDDLTRSDAEDLALEILKQVMEEKINSVNVEVAAVTSQVRTCSLLLLLLLLLLLPGLSSAALCVVIRVTTCSPRRSCRPPYSACPEPPT